MEFQKLLKKTKAIPEGPRSFHEVPEASKGDQTPLLWLQNIPWNSRSFQKNREPPKRDREPSRRNPELPRWNGDNPNGIPEASRRIQNLPKRTKSLSGDPEHSRRFHKGPKPFLWLQNIPERPKTFMVGPRSFHEVPEPSKGDQEPSRRNPELPRWNGDNPNGIPEGSRSFQRRPRAFQEIQNIPEASRRDQSPSCGSRTFQKDPRPSWWDPEASIEFQKLPNMGPRPSMGIQNLPEGPRTF
nr:uncharacterized protein LOC106630545 [Zonotrichia albicollis]